jgi:hypothetical protein
MSGPQIAMAVLLGLAVFIGAVMDGEPKTGTHRFGVTVIGVGLHALILWLGGFWA